MDEDIVPELANYQFNVAKSDVQKMVKADGSTVLNVYFDALYNVVYRYTDGEDILRCSKHLAMYITMATR